MRELAVSVAAKAALVCGIQKNLALKTGMGGQGARRRGHEEIMQSDSTCMAKEDEAGQGRIGKKS